MAKKRRVSASEVMWNRYYRGRPAEIARLEESIEDAKLGERIRELRRQVGLTQKDLAAMIGTQPSAVSRIEDAEYDGHSVETLRKIAKALHARLQISFIADRDEVQRVR